MRSADQVRSVAFETIEHREDRTNPLAHRAALKKLEARDVVAIERDDLAIQDQVAIRKPFERVRDLAEAAVASFKLRDTSRIPRASR